MSYKSIEEALDSLLPQELINIRYVDIPAKGDVLVIEESSVRGKIEELQGYDGLIESNIQFYVRKGAVQGSYVAVKQLLQQFYELVYEKTGQHVGNYSIENVSEYEISPSMRDKSNNVIVSLDFGIKYRVIN